MDNAWWDNPICDWEILMSKEEIEGIEDLKFYAVRSKDGKWFRSKGYGGYGTSWIDNLNGARIYNKPGYARAIVTYFAKHHPSYGYANIVEFTVIGTRIIDVEQEVKDNIKKKEQRKAKQKISHKQNELKRKREELKRAEKELEELTNN